MAVDDLNCRAAAKLLSQAQERMLRDGELQALKRHLALCRHCRDYESQLELMHRAARLFASVDK